MIEPVTIGNATLYCGDALETLRGFPCGTFAACVTSPPYWGGLRDYDDDRQLGMERDPADYVANLVAVFRELRRSLTDDGCLWLNIADAYAASGKGGGGNRGNRACWQTIAGRTGFRSAPDGYKPKDLVMVSFMLADALRADGWYLRKTIIWRKPAAVEPERLDRPSLSHEYIFLLSKSEHYATRNPGGGTWWHHSVWDMAPKGHPGHPAAFPEQLAARCVLASSVVDQIIIDPFAGAGTTGVAAMANRRAFVGIDLNADFVSLSRARIEDAQRQGSLFGEAA